MYIVLELKFYRRHNSGATPHHFYTKLLNEESEEEVKVHPSSKIIGRTKDLCYSLSTYSRFVYCVYDCPVNVNNSSTAFSEIITDAIMTPKI